MAYNEKCYANGKDRRKIIGRWEAGGGETYHGDFRQRTDCYDAHGNFNLHRDACESEQIETNETWERE